MNVIVLNPDAGKTISAEDLISDLEKKKRLESEIILHEIIDIMPGRLSDMKKIQSWLIDNEICTKGQFLSAYNKKQKDKEIKNHVGFVPSTCLDFVAKYAEKQNIKLGLNGELRKAGPLLIDGIEVTEEERKTREVDQLARLLTNCVFTIDDFSRILRIVRNDVKLDYSDSQIADAVAQWQIDLINAKKNEMMLAVAYSKGKCTGPLADEMWQKFEQAAFKVDQHLTDIDWDQGVMPAGFPTKILKKTIWQVKRKMFGYVVTNHLMTLWNGLQGGGKSSAMKLFLSPIAESVREVGFNSIADDRIIDIWSAPVLFIDEMSGANKADIDLIKNVISADFVLRRPMRSNYTIRVPQQTTITGCSNNSLAELIRDTTGMRRFAELYFRDKADWHALNEIDWKMLWVNVDEAGPDPSLDVRDLLIRQQESNRDQHPVEMWASTHGKQFSSRLFSSTDVYAAFREWEKEHFARQTSLSLFGRKMSALIRSDPNFGWISSRTNQFNGYQKIKGKRDA